MNPRGAARAISPDAPFRHPAVRSLDGNLASASCLRFGFQRRFDRAAAMSSSGSSPTRTSSRGSRPSRPATARKNSPDGFRQPSSEEANTYSASVSGSTTAASPKSRSSKLLASTIGRPARWAARARSRPAGTCRQASGRPKWSQRSAKISSIGPAVPNTSATICRHRAASRSRLVAKGGEPEASRSSCRRQAARKRAWISAGSRSMPCRRPAS